jgi:hypothetical protein
MSRIETAGHGIALFITVPQDIAFDARHHDFDPFEIAVIGGILTTARILIGQQNSQDAFAYARRIIDKQLKTYAEHKLAWDKARLLRKKGMKAKAPMIHRQFLSPVYKTLDRSKDLKKIGSIANEKHRAQRRKSAPPDSNIIPISGSRLLLIAGLSRDGGNLARLDRCLRRLQKPMKIAGRELPPLLNSYEVLASGRLVLDVSGDWLDLQYRQVPLPLPTKSPIATSLYLFLQCISTHPAHKENIGFKALCERVGIDTGRPPSRGIQALDRALDVVNDHVWALDADALASYRIKIPNGYEIEKVSEFNIRFVGILRGDRPGTFNGKLRKAKAHRDRRRPKIKRIKLEPFEVPPSDDARAERSREVRRWISTMRVSAQVSD